MERNYLCNPHSHSTEEEGSWTTKSISSGKRYLLTTLVETTLRKTLVYTFPVNAPLSMRLLIFTVERKGV